METLFLGTEPSDPIPGGDLQRRRPFSTARSHLNSISVLTTARFVIVFA
jgi:hypothetical protein